MYCALYMMVVVVVIMVVDPVLVHLCFLAIYTLEVVVLMQKVI